MQNKFVVRLKNFIFSQNYRFTLGLTFIVFINFAMMCATMLKVFGIRGYWMIPLIIASFFLVWLIGYILDAKVKMQSNVEKQAIERSYTWSLHKESFDNVKKILKILEEKK